eukprot:CAMPEP_0170524306 /NCGR_PEP_ID=MMETSP0209-20121228/9738_1 /TAXON_ID=665100 ORGANISM="Litonotus pictus, Strain P1" /NCGR_SAMPLE_ID=MMETSP0209 /ASSEMBLY_ACC=CAM_ASM_000301 /LENGTH=172 /DNA_ID=CAMNT_0010812899 /DNA_START=161 /DNA_END=676 /DNA_ORIENTATION=-
MSYGHYIRWVISVSFGALTTSSTVGAYFLRHLTIAWLISSWVIIAIAGVVGVLISLDDDEYDEHRTYTEEEITRLREEEQERKFSKSSGGGFTKYNPLKYHTIKAGAMDKEVSNSSSHRRERISRSNKRSRYTSEVNSERCGNDEEEERLNKENELDSVSLEKDMEEDKLSN